MAAVGARSRQAGAGHASDIRDAGWKSPAWRVPTEYKKSMIAMKDELILEDFLPYRMSVLSHTISTTIARVYDKRFNLSIPEWRVIAILGRFPGLSAVEVAERTMMDKVAVSRAVTKLVKNGRIDRQFADADRRRSILNLSDEGRKVHDDIAPLALQFERDLLHGISKEDCETFSIVVERLLAKSRLLGGPK